MIDEAILAREAKSPVAASLLWLARAAQARRISAMLSGKDAAIVEAFAVECEAEARRTIARKASRPIAA